MTFDLPNGLPATVRTMGGSGTPRINKTGKLSRSVLSQLDRSFTLCVLTIKLRNEPVDFMYVLPETESRIEATKRIRKGLKRGQWSLLDAAMFLIYRNIICAVGDRSARIIQYAVEHDLDPKAAALLTP
jgi:hypothetical protein